MEKITFRKVQRSYQTDYISIPKKWSKRLGWLNKKQLKLILDDTVGQIIIRTADKQDLEKEKIDNRFNYKNKPIRY